MRYEKGGYYNPHYDACNSLDIDAKINMNGSSGQRYILLIYLNDDLEGGSTYLKIISISNQKKECLFYLEILIVIIQIFMNYRTYWNFI